MNPGDGTDKNDVVRKSEPSEFSKKKKELVKAGKHVSKPGRVDEAKEVKKGEEDKKAKEEVAVLEAAKAKKVEAAETVAPD